MQSLNDNQLLGVTTTEGPVLILAGAGSGKTRVLTERVAYLLSEKGVAPYNILAITFTNKAAGEMRERVDAIAGAGAKSVWVATFHSTCVRILREHCELLGFSKGFSIYDTDDQKAAMKEVLKRLNIDSKMIPEKRFLSRISSLKDELTYPSEVSSQSRDPMEQKLPAVYKAYQERLISQNAMDFDDLIMKTVELFRDFPEVLSKYSNRFKYVMVDEYQDTNSAQFELIRLLCSTHRNLCVVGDDDQSIYKFRGANIFNILNFEKYFPDAVTIKLEENYRSTSQILDAANAVIKNNEGRKQKALWTNNPDGDKIKYRRFETGFEEAAFVASDIKSRINSGLEPKECAVLYRTNMQSRTVEEKLIMENVPYRIVGSVNFYQRKEIKDLIAYLKVIDNGRDDVATLRVINTPKRGIGDTTIEKILKFAVANSLSFYDALLRASEIQGIGKAAEKIKGFTDLIEGYRQTVSETNVSILIDDICRAGGYYDMLAAQDTDEAKSRKENLGELITKAVTYEQGTEEPSLTSFLEEVALIADIDNVTSEENRILLMTIHAAKGLEFDTVYIVGMEEGLFPGMRTISSGDTSEMEEERRLAYVAITRAKRHLFLSSAVRRMINGDTQNHPVSRFVGEIPEEMLDTERVGGNSFGGGAGGSFGGGSGGFGSGSYGGGSFGGSFGPGTSHAEVFSRFATKSANITPPVNAFSKGKEIVKSKPDYNVGDRVKHIKFGEGTVRALTDGGKDYEVSVEFDGAGLKKMFASFAKLVKI